MMYKKSILIIQVLICIIFLNGCTNENIDDNFYIATRDTDDEISLNYLDKDGFAFVVVDSKVESYIKCGNYIFIVQHPEPDFEVDKRIKNYFIVDIRLDYSDQRLRPQQITDRKFYQRFKEICGDKPLKHL